MYVSQSDTFGCNRSLQSTLFLLVVEYDCPLKPEETDPCPLQPVFMQGLPVSGVDVEDALDVVLVPLLLTSSMSICLVNEQ